MNLMAIKITSRCFGAGHSILEPGMRLNLPAAEAYDLIVAGRAEPADHAAQAKAREMRDSIMRRAGFGASDVRHAAHAADLARVPR
jgi:hypothetical protein